MRIHAGTDEQGGDRDQDRFNHLAFHCECIYRRTREGCCLSNGCEAVPQGTGRAGQNRQAPGHPPAAKLRARIETGPGQE
jgi:hypothetical protein